MARRHIMVVLPGPCVRAGQAVPLVMDCVGMTFVSIHCLGGVWARLGIVAVHCLECPCGTALGVACISEAAFEIKFSYFQAL